MLTNKYKRVPLGEIKVERELRQRRLISTDGIKDSIARLGVLHPIIVTREMVLVAGERRYTASVELGLPDIPVRFADELTPTQLQIIELEENSKRMDLNWKDSVVAIERLHKLYSANDPEKWSQEKTAEAIGVSPAHVSNCLAVAREIDKPFIANAQGLAAAINVLSRRAERIAGDALSEIVTAGTMIFEAKPEAKAPILDPSIPGVATPAPLPNIPSIQQNLNLLDSIQHVEFTTWLQTYSGPKFNFVHCDFPYGINVFGGKQSGRESRESYDDSPEIYWHLIRAFCENLDKFMAQSAHLMFWFSMKYYRETLEAFRQLAPSLDFNPIPLVWHKSDNIGILPDSQRGPRQIYETAFIAAREDRKIIKAVSNAYSAPTDRLYHASTKPEPMLRHFFTMFVDENTKLLDPTCGSGSAIRAAESLNANYVLGLEKDEEHHGNACSALKQFRALRRVK